MVGNTPEEAVDAFIGRVRATIDCLLVGTAFGSGNAVGDVHSLTLYTEGQTSPNVARVSTHGGDGELLLRLVHLYTVVMLSNDGQRGSHAVSTSFYQYRILDREESEIVVYHWEPEGISPVRTPHLHVPAAPSIVLPQRAGSRRTTEKTHLGGLHLPTGRIGIADIAELLIRDFEVVPRREDWETVLRENRQAIDLGPTQ